MNKNIKGRACHLHHGIANVVKELRILPYYKETWIRVNIVKSQIETCSVKRGPNIFHCILNFF